VESRDDVSSDPGAVSSNEINVSATTTTATNSRPAANSTFGGALLDTEKDVIRGRSLADDDDLISIFFTAL
jgi:hypothetical protein